MAIRPHIDDAVAVFMDAFGKRTQGKVLARQAATHAKAILIQLADLQTESGGSFKPKVWRDNKTGVANIIIYHDVRNSIVAIGVKPDGSIEGLKKIDGYYDLSKELGIKEITTVADIISKSREMLLRLNRIDEVITPPIGHTPTTPLGFKARRFLRALGR